MGKQRRRIAGGALTALYVEKTKRRGRTYDRQGHGLYLEVSPTGSRRWRQRVTVSDGRRRELSLGPYPAVTLREARLAAAENFSVACRGDDPLVLRRAKRALRVPTFAEAFEEVIVLRRRTWTGPQVEQQWRRSLEAHVSRTFARLLVSEITPHDIVNVLKNLPSRSVTPVSRHISAVLEWSVTLGHRTHNPCASVLKQVMPKPPPARNFRALPYAQVPAALARARESERWIGERLLLEFLVLTAVRSNEARGAVWSEIDWDARAWVIPAGRMKERKEHSVPLSSAALAVLAEARRHPDLEEVRYGSDTPDLVFPSQRGRPLYNNAMSKMLNTLDIPCVPHGFRSSFVDWAAESGYDFNLAELCLAHAVGSEVARRYRRTRLDDPRAGLMQCWGSYAAPDRSDRSGGPSSTPGPFVRAADAYGGVGVVARNASGRDFVVGDVHGCFRTLERALDSLDFDPAADRLFGVGDLVNRGPHSGEALEWLERRFEVVVLGNHDRAALRWFEDCPGSAPPAGSEWLSAIDPTDHPRWRAALRAMPLAVTMATSYGDVGVVHAEVPHRAWSEATSMLERGQPSAVDVALLGVPGRTETTPDQAVGGLRALVHGHAAGRSVRRSANRWNIDTGAGLPRLNRLTVLHVNARVPRAMRFPVDESPC